MAIVAGTLVTYDEQMGSRKEDLINLISNISPTDTPFLSRHARSVAGATLHEHMTDELAARSDNAQIEGDEASFSALDTPDRVTNKTQIFRKTFIVSGTQQVVGHAGLRNMYLYQSAKALKSMTNDIELALLRGSAASGNASTARRLDGVTNCITTTATAIASGTSLTEAFYNGHMQDIWAAGGDPNEVYVGGRVKRQISAYTANSTRNIAADDRRLTNSIDVYFGDFSMQQIILSRDVQQGGSSINVLLALQNEMWRVAWLRKPQMKPLAPTGDAEKGMYLAELTLECLNEKANGKITGIFG